MMTALVLEHDAGVGILKLNRADGLNAQEALALGLVSRVVADDELEATASAVARQIAAYSNPVVRRIKASVNEAQVGLAAGLTAERSRFHACFDEHEFREGLAAFIAKRSPGFLHR